jgi:AcrR family transcriptional regulator
MSLAAPSHNPVASLRDRLCDAAVQVLTAEGWGRVTMARLAEEVGVSRQTVYNEIGTKNDLAETIVLRELDFFLAGVNQSFDEFADDLVEAIRASARRVLKYASDNALLHAVVSASHGADTELLPLLTTNSASLIEGARLVLLDRVSAYPHGLSDREIAACIDLVVRIVLSHVMQPGGEPADVADEIAWVAGRILA